MVSYFIDMPVNQGANLFDNPSFQMVSYLIDMPPTKSGMLVSYLYTFRDDAPRYDAGLTGDSMSFR